MDAAFNGTIPRSSLAPTCAAAVQSVPSPNVSTCDTPRVRSLQELRDVDDPAWPALEATLAKHPGTSALPVEVAEAEAQLVALQITAASTLGAIALHTGGITLDHGWLRMLGGGAPGLPGIAVANGLHTDAPREAPSVLHIGVDVLGGRFALNGGGLFGGPGEVNYWGPDTLEWTPLGGGYSQFIGWALSPALADFYAELRWPGWQDDVVELALDEALSFFPPLCSAESRPVESAARKAVPRSELDGWLDDLSRQLSDPDGH